MHECENHSIIMQQNLFSFPKINKNYNVKGSFLVRCVTLTHQYWNLTPILELDTNVVTWRTVPIFVIGCVRITGLSNRSCGVNSLSPSSESLQYEDQWLHSYSRFKIVSPWIRTQPLCSFACTCRSIPQVTHCQRSQVPMFSFLLSYQLLYDYNFRY